MRPQAPCRIIFGSWLLALLLCTLPLPGKAIQHITDGSINDAVTYGLENKDLGLSTFLGGNWLEGANGALLNVYTPFMEIARTAARRNRTITDHPNAEDVTTARQKISKDISYIYQHPRVKFLVSMFGDNATFARSYYARIEGVGQGRTVTLYPVRSIPQYMAEQDKGAAVKPYTAVNAYHFRYDDIARLDEFVLTLYGKGVTPVTFKVRAKDLQ